ncbi:microtubule-associated protein 10 [Cyclopterus lumpus]|uniref:microtubule-associated protein 10 n=1 Tax=Cyclopterus lumpus TaxID=8103 RepID=UPI0014873F68|nr:microtubule-associated protein 10 [Cyclopterus lumpus]
MSGSPYSDDLETLFSFELLVEYIRVEKEIQVSDELALGVRLLDFPTLLVHRPRQCHDGKDQQGEHAFNRGKSCFFKMNRNSLHVNLSSTPLYVMVLDVKEEIPRLVGTSLISLARAMDRIRQDVNDHGVSRPSSHGERGVVGVCDFTGKKIGSISLSYKLLSLGASLLSRITKTGLKSTSVHGGQHVHQSITVKSIPESLPLDRGNVCPTTLVESDARRDLENNKQSNEKALNLTNEDKQGSGPMPQTVKETERNFDEDLTIFCPPHLFYSNSAEEKNRNEGGDRKLANLDPDVFTFEDKCSEESTGSPVMDRRVRRENPPRNPETSEGTPNALGEALRQLPLLNALLVELSQLNGQNPHQPVSIHPNLSWIYGPSPTQPSAGYGNAPRKEQADSSQKNGQGTGPHFKHVHSPRYRSTPAVRPASVKVKNKQEEALIQSKSSSKSPRKLVYGTTKTFNLRLKQIPPLKIERRECTDLMQNEVQSSLAKGKMKSSNKIVKPSKRKSESRTQNQSSSLNENVETMMQTVAVDSALRGTITLKRKTLRGKVHGEQDGDSSRVSQRLSLSERGLKCIHVPCADGDNVAWSNDKKERLSESNQVGSQLEADGHGEKIESPGSRRDITTKSSFSDSSGEGNEEADYADDFNSLELSEAFSPDPLSSPESSGAKTSRSPVRLDLCNSDSDRFRRRAVLPVPVKAPGSPQRALRATCVIRPRTHASALSFSSEDGDRDGSGSLLTICSRKTIMTGSGRVEGGSGTDGFGSSRGQRSGSTKDSGPARGFSAESVSSVELREVEELEDELGSLDFKKNYRHISELVANKLPGYTM